MDGSKKTNVIHPCCSLCVCVCVYVNPSGQVYNRIGMRLRPFVNDRLTKSHSTFLASLLRLFPPSSMPSSPCCPSLSPVWLSASIMTRQTKPGCVLSFSPFTPISPHFLPRLSVWGRPRVSFIYHSLPIIPHSGYEKLKRQEKRHALKARVFLYETPHPPPPQPAPTQHHTYSSTFSTTRFKLFYWFGVPALLNHS